MIGDVTRVSHWCKTRQTFKCKSAFGNRSLVKKANCQVEYVKECGRHGGPTRCVVVPKQVCGRSSSKTRVPLSSPFPEPDAFVDPIESRMGDGKCQLRVRYVKECKNAGNPRCQVVPVHDHACLVADDTDDSPQLSDGQESDGTDRTNEIGNDCESLELTKCLQKDGADDHCELLAQQTCRADGDEDGLSQDHADVEQDSLHNYVDPDITDGRNEEYKSYGKSEKESEEDPINFTPRVEYDDYGVIDEDDEVKDPMKAFKPEEYQSDQELPYEQSVTFKVEKPKEEKKCKQVCKTVPEQKCYKQQGRVQGEPLCAEVKMEDCSVIPQKNHMEICHSVIDKMCRPVASEFVSDHGNTKCKDVEVYVCSTEHDVDTQREVRASCVHVPVVDCRPVPGFPDKKMCQEKMEQVCHNFYVVEPVAVPNTNCRTEKVRTCQPYVKSQELVECNESERSICGIMQSTELVPDICSDDFYPTCQLAETTVTKCENIMKKICECKYY